MLHIHNSDGFKLKRSAAGLKQPWRFDNISEKQFIEKADTGDILLFRASHVGAKLTRTFTGSHFDHVAMVLYFDSDPNEIYLVDATGEVGVGISRWSDLRKHIGPNKFYHKCVLRHIEFERTDLVMEKLEQFLNEAVGQKFSLNAKKLLTRETEAVKSNVRDHIDEDRTFFCSELLAKGYKVLGIL